MPTAAEILTRWGRKARTATDALIVPALDHMERGARDPAVPLTDAQRSWDAWMKMRNEGAPQEKLDEAERAYRKVSGQEDKDAIR